MASVVKVEATDTASLYDLEYRGSEDDAWYSVYVVFDADAEALRVKHLCAPVEHEAVFSACNFSSVAQVEELVSRFRPVSRQLQDSECLTLSIGTTVCAAHGAGDDDLRFYDAVVEEVEHRPHGFVGGEEECLCAFLLFWKHGRGCGTVTSVNIANICIFKSEFQIDPRINAFAKLVKKKIGNVGSPSNGRKNHGSSLKNDSELSPNRPQEPKTSERLESQEVHSPVKIKTKDLTMISNSNLRTNQDEDFGPISTDGQFFILINNLEKDLTPLMIKNFIHEKTNILAEACVFPSRLTDPFARGAIMVNSLQKAKILHEYLDNPSHLVVSSRGRPWVITEKASAGIFGANIWSFIPTSREESKHVRTHRELRIVTPETDSYKRAKRLRDITIEFLHHESEVRKKLVSDEREIFQSF